MNTKNNGLEKSVTFEEWRDNSMGRNTLRFREKFEGFTFKESRLVSIEALTLAAKLAIQLEKDLGDN